jgi:predicted nucleic acid-binding protein
LGVDHLRAFLQQHRRIALDTCIFIYELEENPRYVELTRHMFSWLERAGSEAVTSTITLTESLVQPYRDLEEKRAERFYGLLSRYPHLQWIAPSLEIADLAARIRAKHYLRTPDALQAATAIHAGATAMITNDAVFERVDSLETLVLDRLI